MNTSSILSFEISDNVLILSGSFGHAINGSVISFKLIFKVYAYVASKSASSKASEANHFFILSILRSNDLSS